MTDSQAYKNFVEQFLEANDWPSRKDGCPVELLDALSEDEKQVAEEELLSRLTPGDDWLIRGLGHLKTQAALPRLKALIEKTHDSMRACVALAIWKISKDDSMCDLILKESFSCYTDDDKSINTYKLIDIIYFLAQLPHESGRKRIQELKSSKNYLIAYNAQRAPEYWRQYQNK